MSRGKQEGKGEGGWREREEGGEGKGGKRVVRGEPSEGFRGMEVHAGDDLQRVERHRTLPSRFQLVIFLADALNIVPTFSLSARILGS